METIDTIRTAVRTRRKALGLKQEDLARIAQVSLPTLKMLEQGHAREVGFQKISRILAALGLELRLQEGNLGRPTLDELRSEAVND